MSTSNGTYDLLESLGATKSKNDKLRILTGATELDQDLMHRALNPYITYGIAKVALPDECGHETIGGDVLCMLGDLASRRLTGNAAKIKVGAALRALTKESQEVLRRILIKDLRCGTGTTLINATFPGLIPEFGVQLSEVYDPKRIKAWPAAWQRKLDGMRAVAVIDLNANAVSFVSREGRPIATLDHIAAILLERIHLFEGWGARRIMLDGEATSGSFNDTISQIKRKKGQADDAVFNVFDVFFEGGNPMSQSERTSVVEKLVSDYASPSVGLVPTDLVHSHEEILERVAKVWAQGGEGGMVKDLDAPYERDRGYNWMKLKQKQSAEFRVIGVFEGTGEFAGTAGGFIVRLGSGGEARVAGITKKVRDYIWTHQDEVIGRLIEVAFHERTPDGSLRHPRFVKFRDTITGHKE